LLALTSRLSLLANIPRLPLRVVQEASPS
jgi:hypothetical protein